MLPVPCAGPAREVEHRALNVWMRLWCQGEGFRIIRHRTFWDKLGLYKRNGLHLKEHRTRLLIHYIKKMAEQLLN